MRKEVVNKGHYARQPAMDVPEPNTKALPENTQMKLLSWLVGGRVVGGALQLSKDSD